MYNRNTCNSKNQNQCTLNLKQTVVSLKQTVLK